MSHWAEVNEDNIVVRVLVGNNDEPDEGYQWLIDNLGGRWVKTSINTIGGVHIQGGTPLRKNYAGIGFSYDETLDAFIPPKPEQFPSFVVSPETGLWVCPIPMPEDEGPWMWNEETVSWDRVIAPTEPPVE